MNPSRISDQSDSGFAAVVYSLGNERIISFRGTDAVERNDVSGPDGVGGWPIATGNPYASQADFAIELYEQVAGNGVSGFSIYHDTPVFDVKLTGHSLGGGLAAFVSTISHAEAVVFDHMPGSYAGLKMVAAQMASEMATDGVVSARMPSLSGIHGYYVSGEALQYIRNGLLQTIADGSLALLPPAVSVGINTAFHAAGFASNTGLATLTTESLIDNAVVDNLGIFGGLDNLFSASVGLHSQALMVTLLYGQTEWSSPEWQLAASSVIPHMSSESIGASLGLIQVTDQRGIEGGITGDQQIANGEATGYATPGAQLASRLAYTAAGQDGPFGGQALKVMFDDMTDMGRIFAGLMNPGSEWQWFEDNASTLGMMVVRAAASTLAGSVAETAVAGIISVSSNLNQFALTANDLELLDTDIAGLLASVSGGALAALSAVPIETYVFVGVGGTNDTGFLNSGLTAIVSTGQDVTLVGSGAKEYFVGSQWDDVFIASEGGDVVSGQGGNDTLSFVNFEGVDVDAFEGTYESDGTFSGIELIIGSDQVDTMRGAAGIVLEGGEGNDVFMMDKSGIAHGQGDNDTFTIASGALPTIYGGEGYDRLIIDSYSFRNFRMDSGQYFDANGAMSIVREIEEVSFVFGSITGTNGSDVIIQRVDDYYGSATIRGGGGDDYITANSTYQGYSSTDAYGEDGNDYLVSLGYDNLYGGAGNDILVGGPNTWIMDGGAGNDVIHCGPGTPGQSLLVYAGSGNDVIYGNGTFNLLITYSFTMQNDAGLVDNGHLISVSDMGDFFRVVTNVGTDDIYDAELVMFRSDDGSNMFITSLSQLSQDPDYGSVGAGAFSSENEQPIFFEMRQPEMLMEQSYLVV